MAIHIKSILPFPIIKKTLHMIWSTPLIGMGLLFLLFAPPNIVDSLLKSILRKIADNTSLNRNHNVFSGLSMLVDFV